MRDFRRFTNVEDLLDDGVENNSDLPKSRPDQDDHTATTDPESVHIQSQGLEKNRLEDSATSKAINQKSRNIYGVMLGVIFSAIGLFAAINPTEMRVEHTRMKYLPTSFEYIDKLRGRIYGSTLFVFGIAVLAFSLYRPKQ